MTPQPYAPYPPPPPQKRSSCSSCLFVGIVLSGLLLCFCVGLTVIWREPLQQKVSDLLEEWQGVSLPFPTDDETNGVLPVAQGSQSANVRSSEVGVVTSPSGASVTIPAAAVPATDAGEVGTMVFSIEEHTSIVPTLADGLESVGMVYRLGPEGFNFNTPVVISIPIPEGINLEDVLGLTTYDAAIGSWQVVPGFVDAELRVVSAARIHLSDYALAGCFTDSLACQEWRRLRNSNFGQVTVAVERVYGTGLADDPLTDTHYNARTVTYGVCVVSYTLDDPTVEPQWIKPTNWNLTLSDYYQGGMLRPQAQTWWLPNGTYELNEVFYVSEINAGDPFYLPKFANYWRPLGTVRVASGSNQRYDFNFSRDGSWVAGRPACWGIPTTSVGTGDVQITLTWQSNDDIDLHVMGPDGYEIYYNAPTSPSGGQLDRDNECTNLELGRPENIFWASGAAPTGSYRIWVHYFNTCDTARAVDWTVRVVRSGQTQTFNGRLSQVDEMQEVTTFTIP